MVDDEKTLNIKVETERSKDLVDKLKQWMIKSRENGEPVCLTCARLDAQKGRLKSYEEYIKDFVLVRKNDAAIRETGSKMEPLTKYVLIDYKCPLGHGFSMHYPASVWNEIQDKKKNTVKKEK